MQSRPVPSPQRYRVLSLLEREQITAVFQAADNVSIPVGNFADRFKKLYGFWFPIANFGFPTVSQMIQTVAGVYVHDGIATCEVSSACLESSIVI
jgi:hypothetical protein